MATTGGGTAAAALVCRDCGLAIPRRRRSGYCRDCFSRRCITCKAPLSGAGWKRTCKECNRRQYERSLTKPDRRCQDCGTGLSPTRHAQRCPGCEHQRYLADQQANSARARPCLDCGALMPKGRVRDYCPSCDRERLRQSIQRRRTGVCPMCHLKFGRTVASPSYCPDCKALRKNLHHAYHRGDPAARALYQPRPRKLRQQKEEEGLHEE